MTEPRASGASGGGPRWAAEAWSALVAEALLFLDTSAALLRQPGRFLRAWRNGAARAMNPLGFFATSLAIGAAVHQLERLLPMGTAGSGPGLLEDALGLLGPYAHYVALGVLCGVLLGGRDLLLALGIALYAGGLANVIAWVGTEMVLLSLGATGARLPAAIGDHLAWAAAPVVIGFVLFSVLMVKGLAAALGRSWVASLAALVVAWLVTGLVLGALDLEGQYGFHLALRIQRTASSWSVTASLGL